MSPCPSFLKELLGDSAKLLVLHVKDQNLASWKSENFDVTKVATELRLHMFV